MPYISQPGRCGKERLAKACLSRIQRDDPVHGICVKTAYGWNIAKRDQLAALREGRETWLTGCEEPFLDHFLRYDLQSLYEEGYYAEVRECVDAVRAYNAEAQRVRR